MRTDMGRGFWASQCESQMEKEGTKDNYCLLPFSKMVGKASNKITDVEFFAKITQCAIEKYMTSLTCKQVVSQNLIYNFILENLKSNS